MHVPVLAGPALAWLRVRPGGTYIDCTAGAGGHSALIAAQLTSGRLLALDRDESAVERAAKRLAEFPQAQVVHANYGDIKAVMTAHGLDAADGILLDAGVSSMQLDESQRGFSLQTEGPLDMRMDPSQRESALDYLRRVSQETLAADLRELGDVQRPGRIARRILERRDAGTLNTTKDLAEAVGEALNVRGKIPQEAYTVFQAIRMRVNEELHWLEQGLTQSVDCLAPEGRLVVISFHSGEDRVVKQVMQRNSRPQKILHPDGRVKQSLPPKLKLLTKKPIQPDEDEIHSNPRSRSARLRAAERLAS